MPDYILSTTCKVDATRLNAGIELALKYSKSTPAKAVNYAAREVAFGAYANTPVTGADRVNRELFVIGSPVIGKSGKILKKKKFYETANRSDPQLAALIVQARANPNSRYNQLTGGRYALEHSPFYGLSRAAGAAAMALMINLMVKGRRRSANGFIRAGWLDAMRAFKAAVPGGGTTGVNIPPGQQESLGASKVAREGENPAYAIIENDVGIGNVNPHHNEALQRVGAPALQLAMDNQGTKEMEYFLRKSGQEELRQPIQTLWG